MSKVKRWYIGVYGGEAQARGCKPHAREIIRETQGEIFVLDADFERVTAERDALQQRLTAADERADVLEGLLLQTNELLYAIQGDPGAVPSSAIDAMRGEVFTAIKHAKPETIAGHHSACRAADDYKPGECSHNCKPTAQPQGEPWRTEVSQFLTDAMTAAGMVRHGKQDKKFAERLADACVHVRFAWLAEQPAPVTNTWPKLSFMAIAAGEHAHADYCQKHAYGSLNEYRNHEALTHAIDVAVAYDKLNSKPAPVAVVMPERMQWDGLRATACNIRGEGWNACLDELKRLNPSL